MDFKNWTVVTIITLIFGTAILATFFLYQKRVENILPNLNPSPPVSGFGELMKSPQSIPESGAVLGTQPQTGINDNPIQTGIVLTTPHQQDFISSPLIINGWSKIESGQITVFIKNQDGQILGQSQITTCPNYEVCPFEANIPFEKPATPRGTIELVVASTDNSLQNPLSIVVQFK